MKPRTLSALDAAMDLPLAAAVGFALGVAGAFLASLTPPEPSPAVSTRESAFRFAGWGEAAGDSSTPAPAPENARMEIDQTFLDAIAAVETNGNDAAINFAEDAHGRYQIRAAALADANRILCTDYTLADCHDPAVAARIVRAYLGHYGANLSAPTPTALARIWNGGPNGYKRDATRGYAERFHRAYLEARHA